MPIDTWFETEFRDRYQAYADKIGRFNLAVFGKSGIGKSTLINAVFGEDLAATGIGEPVTMEGHLYLSSADFLGLYDTRGIEIGKDSEAILSELGELIASNRDKPVSEQIHAAWYCISGLGARIESTEADFVRRLDELGLPVVMVMTQVVRGSAGIHSRSLHLSDAIVALDLPIESGRPVPVMAVADPEVAGDVHGLEELLDATFRIVPKSVEDALTAAQKIDHERKRGKATAAIATASVVAGGIGAIPLPIADAVLLVPLQVGLIASLSAIYGIKPDRATAAAALVPAIASNAGKAAVAGLVKLIPGAGAVIGGAISAVTASVFTGAMGVGWSAVCERLQDGGLIGPNERIDAKALNDLFNEKFVEELAKLFGEKGSAAAAR